MVAPSPTSAKMLDGVQLLVHEPHRGSSSIVSTCSTAVPFRRLVECAALAHPSSARWTWHEVGTADVRFHMGVTAVAGGQRLDQATRGPFAGLRPALTLAPHAHGLRRPFLGLNAEARIVAAVQGPSS